MSDWMTPEERKSFEYARDAGFIGMPCNKGFSEIAMLKRADARIRKLEEKLKTARKDALERLEAWKAKRKAHAVWIEHDDGYGASCWSVTLLKGQDRIVAVETSFFRTKKEPPRNFVEAGNSDDEEDWDWPGLAKTIHAAIDRAEELWPLSALAETKEDARGKEA